MKALFFQVILMGCVLMYQSAAATRYFGTAETLTIVRIGMADVAQKFAFSEAFRLNLQELGSSQITAHAYLMGYSQLGQDWEQTSRYRLNYGYLKWRSLGNWVDLSVGRQFTTVGPYFAAFDGITIQITEKRLSSLKAYYGAVAPLDYKADGFEAWGNTRVFGAQLSMEAIERTNASLSFSRREKEGRVEAQALSLEATRFVPYWEMQVHGSVDFDLVRDQLQRFTLEAKYLFYTGTQLYGEFVHRKPVVDPNSIMAAFDQQPTNEIHMGFRGKKVGPIQVLGHYAPIFYADNAAHSFYLGILSPIGTITSGRDMYGRERRTNVAYSHSFSVTRRINATTQLNWFHHEAPRDSVRLNQSDLFSAQARFKCLVNTRFTLNLDFENNYRQFPHRQRYVRIRSGLTYRFSG